MVQWVQGMTTLSVVAAGVYAIQSGQLTMGGLIACTILTGRSVQPMTQLASLITRAQQALAAFDSVDHLMQLPQERDVESAPLHRPALAPSVQFVDVHYAYEEQPFKALSSINLNIKAGERVGIIGSTGSGTEHARAAHLPLLRLTKERIDWWHRHTPNRSHRSQTTNELPHPDAPLIAAA